MITPMMPNRYKLFSHKPCSLILKDRKELNVINRIIYFNYFHFKGWNHGYKPKGPEYFFRYYTLRYSLDFCMPENKGFSKFYFCVSIS